MNIEAITATLTVSDALNGTINMTKPVALQDNKNVTVSTVQQEITPDTGYDGLKKVTLAALNLQDKTVVLSSVQQTIEADTGYDGLGVVTVPPASAGDSVAKAMFGSDGYDVNTITVEATETKKFFNGVAMLEDLKIVGATGMAAEVCRYWGNVKNIDIDCPYIAVSAFADMPLETIKLRNCTQIKNGAFASYNGNLTDVWIYTDSVCALANRNAFVYSQNFRCHVPQALLADYQTATNWSSLSSQITWVAI